MLVLVAMPTWFPSQALVNKLNVWTQNNFENWSVPLTLIFSSTLAILFSRILAWPECEFVRKIIMPLSQDLFTNLCRKLESEERLVMMTLKSHKVYVGLLKGYPENTGEPYELQSISIRPVASGYRERENRHVIFTTSYYVPRHNNTSLMMPISSIEVIIPRSEIITFGPFDKKIFNHPSNQK